MPQQYLSVPFEFRFLDWCERLEGMLSTQRFRHCLGASVVMRDLAKTYGLDPDTAAATGLLHDCAKDLPTEELEVWLSLTDTQAIAGLPPEYRLPIYLHAPGGAVMAREMFGVEQPEVLTAIRHHCGQYRDDSLLTRCLKLADLIHPTVDYLGRKHLHRLAIQGDFDRAYWLRSRLAREYLERIGVPVHPNFLRDEVGYRHPYADQDYFKAKTEG